MHDKTKSSYNIFADEFFAKWCTDFIIATSVYYAESKIIGMLVQY